MNIALPCRLIASIAICLSFLPEIATAAEIPEAPLLTPEPREISWTQDHFDLTNAAAIEADTADERQVARVLAAEMLRLHGVSLKQAAPGGGGKRIVLALADSPRGRAILNGAQPPSAVQDQITQPRAAVQDQITQPRAAVQDQITQPRAAVLHETSTQPGVAVLQDKSTQPRAAVLHQWPPPRNAEEGYLLEVRPERAAIVALSPRGLLYGCQTLLQMVRPAADGQPHRIAGARILDYPQLGFRCVHICILPNTELAAVRQSILLAARYKYNAVVLEFWSSLKSKSHPETAYEHTFTPEQIWPLIQLGRALHLEMIPMLNSWGHASGMRITSGEHAMLDRRPEFKALFEPGGWSFCLTNPDVCKHLFDRYDELLELFGPVRYFHIGLDEAWGYAKRSSKNNFVI